MNFLCFFSVCSFWIISAFLAHIASIFIGISIRQGYPDEVFVVHFVRILLLRFSSSFTSIHCLIWFLCTLSWFSFQSFSICHDHEFYHVSFCGFHIFASFLNSSFALRMQFWILNQSDWNWIFIYRFSFHAYSVGFIISCSSHLLCFEFIQFCFRLFVSIPIHTRNSRNFRIAVFALMFYLRMFCIISHLVDRTVAFLEGSFLILEWSQQKLESWGNLIFYPRRSRQWQIRPKYDQNWTLELGTSKD